jgi:hypothetical protein
MDKEYLELQRDLAWNEAYSNLLAMREILIRLDEDVEEKFRKILWDFSNTVQEEILCI